MKIHEIEKLAEILGNVNNVHMQSELSRLYMNAEDLSENVERKAKHEKQLKDLEELSNKISERLERLSDANIPPFPAKHKRDDQNKAEEVADKVPEAIKVILNL